MKRERELVHEGAIVFTVKRAQLFQTTALLVRHSFSSNLEEMSCQFKLVATGSELELSKMASQ